MPQTAQQLIRHFCAEVGIEDAEAVLEGAPLEAQGVAIRLEPDLRHEHRVVIEVEFGDLPKENQLAIALRLLEHNYLAIENLGSFSLSPLTGKIVLCQRLDASDCAVEALLEHFDYLQRLALDWREKFFMDDDEQAG